MKQATLCYLFRDSEVLLGMKKVRFGAGKWNGFGGKVEVGEAVENAVVREVKEESGIIVHATSLKKVAVLQFYFAENPIFECHVFTAHEFSGEPQENEEMAPSWFSLDKLPYKDMWPSDLYWLPAVLAGDTIEAVCHFDADGKVVNAFEMKRKEF